MGRNNFNFLSFAVILGFFILGFYLNKSKKEEGTLIVKGLSERKVKATKAMWALNGSYRGSPVSLKYKVENHIKGTRDFLKEKGFTDAEISVGLVDYILDYNNTDNYTVSVSVRLETNNVDLVAKVYSESHELINKGIMLSGGKWQTAPRYFVEDLQTIKSDLLKSSCTSAQQSAADIVKNMGAELSLGRVIFVNQGVLDIRPSDDSQESHEYYKEKIYRLVSTVKYSIE